MAITVAQSYLLGYLNLGLSKEYWAFCTAVLCLPFLVCGQASETLSDNTKVTHHVFQGTVRCTFLKGLLGSSWYFSSYLLLCGQRSPCIGECKRTTLKFYIFRKSPSKSPKQCRFSILFSLCMPFFLWPLLVH